MSLKKYLYMDDECKHGHKNFNKNSNMQKQRYLFIPSALRRNPHTTSTDDIVYDLREEIRGKYSLEFMTFFNSIYNIRSTNNTIYFYENGTDKSCTITPGVYDDATLATAMKTALDTASGGFNTFTVTYSSITGKYTFSGTSNFHFTFESFTANTIAKVIGFYRVDGVAATSQTGDFMAQLQGVDLIGVDIRTNDRLFDFYDNHQGSSYFTFVIPNNVDNFTAMTYKPDQSSPVVLDFGVGPYVNHIQITIKDGVTGDALSLNGADYYIVLRKLCNDE